MRTVSTTLLVSSSQQCTPVHLISQFVSVEVREIAGRKVTVFKQELDEDTSIGKLLLIYICNFHFLSHLLLIFICKLHWIATILVRASTEHVLNDIERALDDGINSVKTLCNEPRLLAGAGAVELELNKAFADTVVGLDQYAIRKFGESFDVVPRQLAENSGQDPTSMMHALHLSHMKENGETQGFDIEENCALDSVKAGVFDLYGAKVNALRLAVDAAITILRVDQIVMSKPAGGPKPPAGGGGGD
jgi:chaperonin GroEL (HSP60 family)